MGYTRFITMPSHNTKKSLENRNHFEIIFCFRVKTNHNKRLGNPIYEMYKKGRVCVCYVCCKVLLCLRLWLLAPIRIEPLTYIRPLKTEALLTFISACWIFCILHINVGKWLPRWWEVFYFFPHFRIFFCICFKADIVLFANMVILSERISCCLWAKSIIHDMGLHMCMFTSFFFIFDFLLNDN